MSFNGAMVCSSFEEKLNYEETNYTYSMHVHTNVCQCPNL